MTTLNPLDSGSISPDASYHSESTSETSTSSLPSAEHVKGSLDRGMKGIKKGSLFMVGGSLYVVGGIPTKLLKGNVGFALGLLGAPVGGIIGSSIGHTTSGIEIGIIAGVTIGTLGGILLYTAGDHLLDLSHSM